MPCDRHRTLKITKEHVPMCPEPNKMGECVNCMIKVIVWLEKLSVACDLPYLTIELATWKKRARNEMQVWDRFLCPGADIGFKATNEGVIKVEVEGYEPQCESSE